MPGVTSGRICGISIKTDLDGAQALRFWGGRLGDEPMTDVVDGSADLDKESDNTDAFSRHTQIRLGISHTR